MARTPQPIGSESTPTSPDPQTPPPSWSASIASFIQTRIELIQAEAQAAVADRASRVVMAIAAAFLAIFCWLLINAAIAGILHTHANFPWYWGCLALAGIHLLAILALARAVRAPVPPAFQHTRSEFNKDREWLQSLQKPKSNN